MQVKSTIKAGRISGNHNEALKVRTQLRGGRIAGNHNEALKVRSQVKGGRIVLQPQRDDAVKDSAGSGLQSIAGPDPPFFLACRSLTRPAGRIGSEAT